MLLHSIVFSSNDPKNTINDILKVFPFFKIEMIDDKAFCSINYVQIVVIKAMVEKPYLSNIVFVVDKKCDFLSIINKNRQLWKLSHSSDEEELSADIDTPFDGLKHQLILKKEITHKNNNQFVSNHEIVAIDHIAFALLPGTSSVIVDWYKNVFQFETLILNKREEKSFLTIETINKNGSKLSMNLHSLIYNSDNPIRFVFAESNKNAEPNQIDDFLNNMKFSGVQHIAFSTNDIGMTIEFLRNENCPLINTPEIYYKQLLEAFKKVGYDKSFELVTKLRPLGVLIDNMENEEKVLLQIFTRTVFQGSSVFFEVIQRLQDVEGFGSYNVVALWNAIESTR